MISTTSIKRYSISTIRDEAANLLEMGVISLDQPLRILFEYLPAKKWNTIECELEMHDYLLRDRIIDLVGEINWDDDQQQDKSYTRAEVKRLEIEKISDNDLRPVSTLFIDVFSNPPWNEYQEFGWAYERLNWIYNHQGFKGYLANDGDRLIGALMGYFMPFQGKKGFKIEEFLVQTESQNQGIGAILLNRLESDLKQDNYDFVNLLTARDSSAESFYTKRGYQRDRQIVLLNKEL